MKQLSRSAETWKNLGFLAFTFFHAAVPLLGIAAFDASPAWLPGSILFSIAVFVTARYSRTPVTATILCLVSGLYMLLNLMLSVSWYLQGTGFNDQYFYHLDGETLAVAVSAYGSVFFPAILYLLLAFIAPLLLYRKKSVRPSSAVPAAMMWVAALVASYPVHSLVDYRFGAGGHTPGGVPRIPAELQRSIRFAATANPVGRSEQPRPESDASVGKNTILIYAEGLEQIYFERAIFGEIVPGLRALSGQAHRFTNAYQVRGTSGRPDGRNKLVNRLSVRRCAGSGDGIQAAMASQGALATAG